MAGGEGTRLRPLTCDLPKPMARLCGRPVLEYILDLLGAAGVTEAAVTLRYLPRAVADAFPEGEYRGIRLRFVEEDRPLGTAGGVKNAAGDGREDLLVVSGDALCDFDLAAACRFHREAGAAATLVLTHVGDPREYGLVLTEPTGRVRGFVEKPGWAQAVTDAVNTGIYILGPQALAMIPEGRPFDFAKDLFPMMLAEELPLYGFEAEGYWCDIGDIGAYTSCQFDILEHRVNCALPEQTQPGVVCRSALPPGNYRILPPAYIGRGVKIGEYSVVGPYAVLDDGCTVGGGATVKNSVLLADSFAGDRCELRGALLCHGASLKRGAGMFEGSVAGAGSVIGRDAAVSPGVRVWPGKRVEDGARAAVNLKYGGAHRALFDEEGISGEVGVDLTPEICAKIGAAAAGISDDARVGIGDDGSNAGRTLREAVRAGVLSTGAQVCDFGAGFEALFHFAVDFCGLTAGVFTRAAGSRAVLKLTGKNGLSVGRPAERKIEAAYAAGEIERCAPSQYRAPFEMSGISALYQRRLMTLAPEGLQGTEAAVRSPNKTVQRLMAETLAALGCREPAERGALRIHLTAGGGNVSIFDENGRYLDAARTLALGCLFAFESGQDVALPYDAPRAVDTLAARYGRRVLRYLDCPADASDAEARALAASQPWVRDGLCAALRLLDGARRRRITFSALAEKLPAFATAVRAVRVDGNPGKILRGLSGSRPRTARGSGKEAASGPEEGVRISIGGGDLLLSPLKKGGGIRIMAEAADMEAAAELCADAEKRLQTAGDRSGEGGSAV